MGKGGIRRDKRATYKKITLGNYNAWEGGGKMAINDVVSRVSLSHKRRETTRGGRVPQKVEK